MTPHTRVAAPGTQGHPGPGLAGTWQTRDPVVPESLGLPRPLWFRAVLGISSGRKFLVFDVTEPCKFIGFGAIYVIEPYKCIESGAIDVTG